MIKLNDYLGSIVASFTNAKIMSDLQTVKLAEEYAKHDYLKHFSIPRMRIDDVEMTIPIALDEIENISKPPVIGFDSIKINTLVYSFLLEKFGVLKITKEPTKLLQTETARQVSILEKQIKITNSHDSILGFSKEIVVYYLKIIEKYALVNKEVLAKMNIDLIVRDLITVLMREITISKEVEALANLNIVVEANKLRELKSENLIFIKLKISENGMEWSRSENAKGEIESKLLPE
ncbi:hypothetical protein IQ05_01293 [Flavobacterium tiangeerense]|uniref:Uncharacterized protein n=1 Tax=Flavobacterium tiangeerense TaxID=459471 RepID=A0ABY3FKW3_9FLAO|nr:hypothetical protein [Flavobacterium tiangeerense]TWI00636.1 hypothetical protein IQ05_01293 [Flavobacterium tiangeerense]